MSRIIKFFVLPLFIICLTSCKKNQTGGNADLMGTVSHHHVPIANARVFVKYNAKEFPGRDTSLYDLRIVTDEHGKFFIEVYKGDYYLFSKGYDPAIKLPVEGGIPVKIKRNEKKTVEVPVTE